MRVSVQEESEQCAREVRIIEDTHDRCSRLREATNKPVLPWHRLAFLIGLETTTLLKRHDWILTRILYGVSVHIVTVLV